MNKGKLTKSLNKYSKEVLIKTLLSLCWYDEDKILDRVKEINRQMNFKKLTGRSKEIGKEIQKLHSKDGISSIKKVVRLLEEDEKIHDKIDKLL